MFIGWAISSYAIVSYITQKNAFTTIALEKKRLPKDDKESLIKNSVVFWLVLLTFVYLVHHYTANPTWISSFFGETIFWISLLIYPFYLYFYFQMKVQ